MADRPAVSPEVKVTCDMLSAGLEEFGQHRYGDDTKYMLESVYRAMFYASLDRASSTRAPR